MNFLFTNALTAAQRATDNVQRYRVKRKNDLKAYTITVTKSILALIDSQSLFTGITKKLIIIDSNLNGVRGPVDQYVKDLRKVSSEELAEIGSKIESALSSKENGFTVSHSLDTDNSESIPQLKIEISWPAPEESLVLLTPSSEGEKAMEQ